MKGRKRRSSEAGGCNACVKEMLLKSVEVSLAGQMNAKQFRTLKWVVKVKDYEGHGACNWSDHSLIQPPI